jgi:hypothetical protein
MTQYNDDPPRAALPSDLEDELAIYVEKVLTRLSSVSKNELRQWMLQLKASGDWPTAISDLREDLDEIKHDAAERYSIPASHIDERFVALLAVVSPSVAKMS